MNWTGYGVLNAHGAMCNENWPNSYARDLLHLRIPNLPHFFYVGWLLRREMLTSVPCHSLRPIKGKKKLNFFVINALEIEIFNFFVE